MSVLREETYRVMDRPQMQVDVIEGRFLKMLVRLTGARTILEIGMFTGYSALMMGRRLADDGRLITCEVDPKAGSDRTALLFREPARTKDHGSNGTCPGNDQHAIWPSGSGLHRRGQGELLQLLRSFPAAP